MLPRRQAWGMLQALFRTVRADKPRVSTFLHHLGNDVAVLYRDLRGIS